MNKLDLLKNLFAAFPSSHPTEQTFNVYLETLADVPFEKLEAAAKQIIRDGGAFPPSVGDLIKIIKLAPGASSPTSQERLEKPIPQQFFRLDPEEDRRQRLERLRQTAGWSKYYA